MEKKEKTTSENRGDGNLWFTAQTRDYKIWFWMSICNNKSLADRIVLSLKIKTRLCGTVQEFHSPVVSQTSDQQYIIKVRQNTGQKIKKQAFSDGKTL